MRDYTIRASGLAGAARGALCAALDTRTPISGLTPDHCPDIPGIDLCGPFPGLRHRSGTTGDMAAAWNITHADMALIITDRPKGRHALALARLAEQAGVPHAVGGPENIGRTGRRLLDGFVHGGRRIVIAVEGDGEIKRMHARAASAVIRLLAHPLPRREGK